MAELIAVIALVVLALVAVAGSVRVVQQSTIGVVQRLGRNQRTLGAEADQQANVLRAEGEKQARALRAEGDAQALGRIFDTVREAGIAPSDMLGYKYLEALPQVAAGDANKLLLLPIGAADAMGAVAGLGAAFSEGATEKRKPEPRRTPPPAPPDGS